jgi:S-adenosylmethionine:tRNA ribosyltransferase-isomerase
MHGEQVKFTAGNIDNLLKAESLVAVGTTSLRTLESLYWFGVRLLNNLGEDFNIASLAPYETYQINPDFKRSLVAVKAWMSANRMDELSGYTEIFIFPPYQIKSCSGLITNFHLPSSTLILLVAAFIGQHWQEVYQQAIDHGYRFLSYGDSSLLLPPNAN